MQNKSKIHRSKIIGNFTKVANDLIRSKDLTMQEKSLLIFILSHPENFAINRQYFYNSFTDSKGSIDTAFAGLIKKNYIHSYKVIGDNGRFKGINYEVFETPKDHIPQGGNPHHGKPTHGESTDGQTGERISVERKPSSIVIHDNNNNDSNNNELDNNTDYIKAKEKFSLLQCKEIFNHHGQIEQAELFHAHYNSVDWMTNGQEIKNLGSLIQKWILNQKQKSNGNQRPLTAGTARAANLINSGTEFLERNGDL
jgi:hypothetical protein